MIGGLRFPLARARAALPPLITLAIVAAVAGALLAGVVGAISATEAQEVRAGLAGVAGGQGRVVVDVRGGATPEEVAATVEGLMADAGATGSTQIQSADGDVVITPDLSTISAAHLPSLIDALGTLLRDVEQASGADIQVSGSLDSTLQRIDGSLQTRRGPTAVAVGLLGLITAVVIGAVAVESVRLRSGENHLLRARGARRRSLFWGAALESFVFAVVGAIVGGAIGAVAASLIASVPLDILFFLVAAAVIALAAALVAAVATVRGVDRRSTRAQAVADIGVVVVLAILTAAAVWQFLQTGTPVVSRGDATVIDPLVAIAPALALGFAALVAVALATPIARGIAASLARTRAVSPITPLRLASRRPGRHVLSIIVVAFAVGTVTLAGTYHGTVTSLGDAPEQLRVGADVRVTTIPEDVDTAEVAALQPANASMRARQLIARVTGGNKPLLAAESQNLGEVMLDAGGEIDPAALGTELTVSDAGAPITDDAVTFTVDAPQLPEVKLPDGAMVPTLHTATTVIATFVGPTGTVTRTIENFTTTGGDVTFTSDPEPHIEVDLTLPADGPWTLTGLQAKAHGFYYEVDPYVIVRATSGGAPLDLSGFQAASGTPGVVEAALDGGLQFTMTLDRFLDNPFTKAIAPDIPTMIPVVITQGIAASMSLERDEQFALELDSPRFDADFVVADIIPVLPGTPTGEGMLADLAMVSLVSPLPIVANQVWFSSDEPAELAVAAEEQFPATVTTIADPQAAQNAAGTAIAFALAAGGAVLLALIVLLLRRSRTRADSRELALFAVMGLGRARASRVRAQEDLFAVAIGVIGGLAAGVVTAWLAVPSLVRTAYETIPDAYPVTLQAQPLPLAMGLTVAVAVFCVIVATVRTPARLAPLLREDE
ncbi:MAG TPA: FtsX-like permease family protein [Microbacterium sp.]|nr:FtsX-like permease family protein [Microbacterium sp.]